MEKETLTRKGGYLGTMTGRGRELADSMEQRNVDILCLQEKSGKEVKQGTFEVNANYFTTELMEEKMIEIVMREELAESVLEVKRVSDRLMAMKLEV